MEILGVYVIVFGATFLIGGGRHRYNICLTTYQANLTSFQESSKYKQLLIFDCCKFVIKFHTRMLDTKSNLIQHLDATLRTVFTHQVPTNRYVFV